MKYCSIDIETCGLDPETCDILEFGAILDDLSNPISLEKLPVFHCYFVLPVYRGEPFALSMHGKIFRRIADREEGFTYMSPTRFGNSFKQFLLKHGYEKEKDRVTINVAGKNYGIFDHQFLIKHTDMEKHVNVRHRIIDPAILFLQEDDEAIPGIEKCKTRANIEGTVAHTSVEDALDVVRLMRHKLGGKS